MSKHYLEITRRHTLRLGQLVGDLFELSKLDSASITPKLETFSLAELLQDVTQDFELEANKAGITMKIEAVVNIGALVSIRNAPPSVAARFPEIVTLVNSALEPSRNTPPPAAPATLLAISQLTKAGAPPSQ